MIEHGSPVRSGDVHRQGHRIHWEEFGAGPDVLLLLPTWSIVHSDFWRHQVPHFAHRRRVIVFDGLGNGASDRPIDPSCYGDLLVADDAVAVLDACGVGRVTAVLGSSQGGAWALALAALHPERVSSAVFIAPNVPLAPGHPDRVAAAGRFLEDLPEHPGWLRWNRAYWLADFPDFLRFFFSQCFTEPHSETEIEHFLAMGLETTPEVLLATGGDGRSDLTAELARDFAGRLECPALVLHGDQDAITPVTRGQVLAELCRGELVVLPGSGHEPHCRNPEVTNGIIDDFLGSLGRE